MSFQEKKNIVALLSTLVIFTLYCMVVFQRYQAVNLESTELFKFWGSAILILIPVSMVAKIITHIIFSIINTIATKEIEPKFSDELDKLIELKATTISHYVFVIGFLLAIGSLVINMPPTTMFIIFIFSGFVSEVIGILTQLYLYRRGI